MEGAGMTVDSLIADIDWDHIKNVMALHWVQVLVEFIPQLHPFQKELSARFRYAPIVRHHMCPGRKLLSSLWAQILRERLRMKVCCTLSKILKNRPGKMVNPPKAL